LRGRLRLHQQAAKPPAVAGARGSTETYALAVLDRYLNHLRTHLDDNEDIITGEFHIQVSVWPVDAVTASASASRPSSACLPRQPWHSSSGRHAVRPAPNHVNDLVAGARR
jgi:hypothetical protein